MSLHEQVVFLRRCLKHRVPSPTASYKTSGPISKTRKLNSSEKEKSAIRIKLANNMHATKNASDLKMKRDSCMEKGGFMICNNEI
jgi:hypothetical protein